MSYSSNHHGTADRVMISRNLEAIIKPKPTFWQKVAAFFAGDAVPA